MLALTACVPVIPAFIDRRVHTNRFLQGIVLRQPTQVLFGPPMDLSPYYDAAHDSDVLRMVSEMMMDAIDAQRPTEPTVTGWNET